MIISYKEEFLMLQKELGQKLKEILKLKREPVAIKWSSEEPTNIAREEKSSRFCVKLEKAMNGEIFYSTSEDELCMGGGRYSGLKDEKEFPEKMRSGAFLIPRGVYESIPAVQRSWKNNLCVPSDIFKAIIFAPLRNAEFIPDVVLVLGNAKQGMELLHANAYDSGSHGLGADSGPICSSMAATPYITGKVTYGFADVGSRRYMDLEPEEVMVSIPFNELGRIVSNLERMHTKIYYKEK
jgi:uncharacterized protein (DUF169 family)